MLSQAQLLSWRSPAWNKGDALRRTKEKRRKNTEISAAQEAERCEGGERGRGQTLRSSTAPMSSITGQDSQAE